MSTRGPITALLEEEVKRELREHGVVVWLDRDASYNAYADALAERFGRSDFFAPVVRFRGSYLEMLLALDGRAGGLDPEPLLLHLPGHNEDTVRQTPLLELYRAGTRFRKSLGTLVREAARGMVSPAEIEAFLESSEPTLERAEAWLAEKTARQRAGLDGHLESLALEWGVDGLLGPDPQLRKKVDDDPDGAETLVGYLNRHTGMDEAFVAFFLGNEPRSGRSLAEAFAAWLLCVEYVHDLSRPPGLDSLKPLRALSPPLRKACERLVGHLRERHPDEYERYADQTEQHLAEEFASIGRADLGSRDTFRREEQIVLEAATQAFAGGRWEEALASAQPRGEGSFWLRRDPFRRLAWSLVRSGADLGARIDASPQPLQGRRTLREALETYTGGAFEVDRAHRRFEQERLQRMAPQLPYFALLLQGADHLRSTYRAWSDGLSEDFNAICRQEGFLPDTDLQQRTLYEQVVHPLVQAGEERVGYLLVDSLRYEMAAELAGELQESGTRVALKARYAELPSITAVGMNVLAPVSQGGRLVLGGSNGFGGFRAGEYTVRTPEDRVRAMAERSVDGGGRKKRWIHLRLGEVCNAPPEELQRKLKDARLIVVHSKEIDDAGEADVGLATFETWLAQLKSAWHHLRAAGVNELVITADHGFLLQDATARVESYGDHPCRRYVLSADLRAEDGLVGVSLAELGYEGRPGFLLFRTDTALFDAGRPGATFVHGGNSLQERVVPVLQVSHRMKPAVVQARYRIEAEPQAEVLGLSRIRLRVKPDEGVLSIVAARHIELALRVPGRDDVRVAIQEAIGSQVTNQVLRVPVEGEWSEVLFTIEGPMEERVRVEIFHPDATQAVNPCELEAFFPVRRAAGRGAGAEPRRSEDWSEAIADPAVRSVFQHLQQHGSINEAELVLKLGSPRNVRRFAVDFESYLQKVPFSVRIEASESGKRYVKQ